MTLQLPFVIERPYGRVTVVLEVFEEDGSLVCGIYKLDGKITLPPRRWLSVVRSEVRKLETIAREAGCHEMRVAGRDWSPILTDYEPFDGPTNGLRKRL